MVRLPLMVSVSLLSIFYVSVAEAQTAPQGGTAQAQDAPLDGIAEIIVTARKTAENLQSVPVAVTALGGETLQTRTVQNVRDIQFNVPGLVNFPEPQGGAPDFAIRGTRQQGITGSQGGVAVYLGYVPLTSTMAIKNSNFDLQSVQVLKGPQGTLFGKNTTGGAIIFTPNTPTNSFEGMVKGQYGNWNRIDLTGVINIPLGEGIALRLGGRVIKTDGWQKNIAEASDPIAKYYDSIGWTHREKNLWAEDNQSLRASLKIEPSDTLTNTTMIDYYHQSEDQTDNQGGVITEATGTCGFLYGNCPADFALQQSLGYKKVRKYWPIFVKGTWWGATNTTELDLGNAKLRNILGYRSDKLENMEEDDGVTSPLLKGWNSLRTKALTDEINLMGKAFDDRLDYTVGAFYSRQRTHQQLNFEVLDAFPDRDPFYQAGLTACDLGLAPPAFCGVPGQGADVVAPFLPPASALNPRFSRYTYKSRSLAGFGQINYKVDDKLTLTVGARYTQDKQKYSATEYIGQTNPAFTGPFNNVGQPTDASNMLCATGAFTVAADDFDPANCLLRRKATFNSFIFNGGLQYHAGQRTMIYVNVAKGFQSGGFNNQMILPQYFTFAPETVMNFETGVKKDWEFVGRPIRTNIALFYSKFKNQQRSLNGSYSQQDVTDFGIPQSLVGGTWISVFNAANSTTWGGEVEISYNITDNLRLSGFYSYISAKYDSFIAPPIGNTGTLSQLAGRPLSSTPKHTANVNATYSIPVNADKGAVRLTLNGYYRSSVEADDLFFGPETHIKGYVLANGRIDLVKTLPADIGFWVNNLFDKKYAINKNQTLSNFGLARTGFGEPRSYGVEITYRF